MKIFTRLLVATLAFTLTFHPSAHAYSRQTSTQAPDTNKFTVTEYAFDGTGPSKGRWERLRLATPRQVICTEFIQGRSNCQAEIWMSGESWMSADPTNRSERADQIYRIQTTDSFGPNATTVFVQVKVGQPIGSLWSSSMLYFMMRESGVALMLPLKLDPHNHTPVQINVIVPTAAEAAAERAAAELAAAERAAAAEAARIAKILGSELTITCKSGSKSTKVTGDPPACPKGFTNPMASHPAFQAYAKCKLYKKTQGSARAKLQNSGKTLSVSGFGRSLTEIDFDTKNWACVTRELKIPSTVLKKIEQKRATDHTLSAKFGVMNADWTYHPDYGLDITFEGVKTSSGSGGSSPGKFSSTPQQGAACDWSKHGNSLVKKGSDYFLCDGGVWKWWKSDSSGGSSDSRPDVKPGQPCSPVGARVQSKNYGTVVCTAAKVGRSTVLTWRRVD